MVPPTANIEQSVALAGIGRDDVGADVRLGQHDALRLARGAARIGHRGEILRRHSHVGWAGLAFSQFAPAAAGREYLLHDARQVSRSIRRGYEQACARVANLLLQLGHRVERVQRYHPSAGAEGAEPGQGEIDGVGERNGHRLPGR